VTFNVDDVLTDESISEKDPLPPAEMPHDQDDSPTEEQQLRKEIDEMKKNVDQYLSDRLRAREIAKKELADSSNNLSDAEKAKLTATMNGVSEPTRKRDGGKPTDHGFRSDDHYDWCRLKHIMKLIKSEAALSVPLFAEQCVRVLHIVRPIDLHVLWVNHCATQYNGNKGHCNTHCGNSCRQGYRMRDCTSVNAMIEIAKYFELLTSIKFSDVVEHVQCANLREFCPTEGRKFQRCPVGRESETKPLVGVFNDFLQALSELKVYTIVASSAGKTSGVEELVLHQLMSPSSYIMIVRKTLWHLQFNMVQHEAKSPSELGNIMTKQWEILSSRFMMPSLKKAGISPTETIVDYMKENDNIIFVTHDVTQLDFAFPKYIMTKEDRIENLLAACKAACLYDADARVGDQVHIIQLYAQNHWYEIQERLGSDAPNS